MSTAKREIILGVTGSIAAYKACDIAGALVRAGFGVNAILTQDGARFITALTLQTISRNKVITDMFDAPGEWCPTHTSLADRADAILIAPATANVIGKLAGGIADDMLTCTVFASKAPVVIAPAMNDHMYEHPVIKANIVKLAKIGYSFVGPVRGRLACGRQGMGHLADTDAILKAVTKALP